MEQPNVRYKARVDMARYATLPHQNSVNIFEGASSQTSEETYLPTPESIRADRARLAEEERISAILDAYGDDDPGEDGALITFAREVASRTSADETIILRYAFVRAGGSYYGTGRQTPQGVPWARLVNYLIKLGVEPFSVSFCQQGGGDERFIPLEAAL